MHTLIHAQNSTMPAVMTDLATSLGVDLVVNNYEYLCPIPPHIGSGFIKASTFQNEIIVLEISCICAEELMLSIKRKDNDLVRLLFNLNSSFNYFSSERGPHKLGHFDSLVHALTRTDKSDLVLSPNTPVSIFLVDLYNNVFMEKIRERFNSDTSEITDFLEEVKTGNGMLSKSSFTLNLNNLISNYIKNSYSGPMRFIYQEAKVSEIILERMKQYMDDRDGDSKVILRKSTIKSIEKAAQWIASNLDTKKSINELAKDVGLSQQTLQHGFRHQFGCSVNDFIVTAKLNKAVELLEKTALNITEITYELGISSKSYFAKIFQERYGITPRAYKKLKQNLEENQSLKNKSDQHNNL